MLSLLALWLYSSVVEVWRMVRSGWWTKPDKFVGITFMMFSWNRAIHFCWTSKAKETCFVISCYHYIAHDINGRRQGKRRWALCPCVVRLENWWAKKEQYRKTFLYWIKKEYKWSEICIWSNFFISILYSQKKWMAAVNHARLTLWRWCVFSQCYRYTSKSK